MKLLIVYGSPAVGKLTVATEIAKQTGYKLFHNHLSIDCVEPVFEFGSPAFFKLVHLIRVEIIAEAARQNINLIYTFCYAKDSDDHHIEQVTKAVVENGGEVCYCLLTADKAEIEKRVLEESRTQYFKVNNLKLLHEMFEKYELFSPVNNYESLIIDNTNLPPEETARLIIEHFSLKEIPREYTNSTNKFQ